MLANMVVLTQMWYSRISTTQTLVFRTSHQLKSKAFSLIFYIQLHFQLLNMFNRSTHVLRNGLSYQDSTVVHYYFQNHLKSSKKCDLLCWKWYQKEKALMANFDKSRAYDYIIEQCQKKGRNR